MQVSVACYHGTVIHGAAKDVTGRHLARSLDLVTVYAKKYLLTFELFYMASGLLNLFQLTFRNTSQNDGGLMSLQIPEEKSSKSFKSVYTQTIKLLALASYERWSTQLPLVDY